jgi:hypothetical protein
MRSIVWGFGYGLLLVFLCIVISGGGHGLVAPLSFVGAPLTLIPAGAVLIPFLAAAAAWCSVNRPRIWFSGLMLLHYVAGILIGVRAFQEDRASEAYLEKLQPVFWWIVVLAVVYLVGQGLLWGSFVRFSRRGTVSSA